MFRSLSSKYYNVSIGVFRAIFPLFCHYFRRHFLPVSSFFRAFKLRPVSFAHPDRYVLCSEGIITSIYHERRTVSNQFDELYDYYSSKKVYRVSSIAHRRNTMRPMQNETLTHSQQSVFLTQFVCMYCFQYEIDKKVIYR